MMGWRSWKVWSAALIAAALITVSAFAFHKAGLACANPQKRMVFKIFEANGCIEFWLNRYQSLASAVIAAAVALIVVRPVIQQLRVMNRQSAVSAREIIEASTRELSGQIEDIGKMLRCVHYTKYYANEIIETEIWPDIYKKWFEEFDININKLHDCGQVISSAIMRDPDNIDLNEARKAVLSIRQKVLASALLLRSSFQKCIMPNEYDESVTEHRVTEIAAIAIDDANDLERAATEVRSRLEHSRRENYRRSNSLATVASQLD